LPQAQLAICVTVGHYKIVLSSDTSARC